MEAVYDWVRNIIFFIIWINIIMNILPDKKYDKYIRLFTGIILIILIIRPFNGGKKFDDRIKKYVDSIELSQDAGELSRNIMGIETEKFHKILDQYKEAIILDIEGMAEQEGFDVISCNILMDENKESTSFGKVKAINVTVDEIKTENKSEIKTEGENDIELVQIEKISTDYKTNEQPEKKDDNKIVKEQKTDTWSLRKKIAEYYELEVSVVNVRKI